MKSLKVTSVPYFILDFNLLSRKLHKGTFEWLYCIILYWYYVQEKQICNTLTVTCEKSKIASFVSLIIKKISAPSDLRRFPEN